MSVKLIQLLILCSKILFGIFILLLSLVLWYRQVCRCCSPDIIFYVICPIGALLMVYALLVILYERFVYPKRQGRWGARLKYLNIYFWALCCVYYFLPHEPRAVFVGVGYSGVVSSSVLDVITLISCFLTAILLAFSCFESCVRVIHLFSGGLFAITAILMPSLLEQYDLVQAYLSVMSDVQYEILFEVYNVYFSMVLAFVAFYATYVLQSQSRVVQDDLIHRTDDSTMSVWPGEGPVAMDTSVGSSSASHGVANNRAILMRSVENLTNSSAMVGSSSVPHRSADHVAMPSRLEEPRSSSSVSVGSSSGFRSVAVPKQLMGAAVSGLVAGACFSVASRLFSRR